MNKNNIWQAIESEMKREKKLNPHWPDHVVAQAGMVAKEVGRLMSACITWKYDRSVSDFIEVKQKDRIKRSGINVIVMAIRFLENLK